MSQPTMPHLMIKGGEQLDLPAEQAGAGHTVPYLDTHCRLIRGSGDEWMARLVQGEV